MAAYGMTNQEAAKHCEKHRERGMIMEKPEGRLDSIDALRGFDMLFIFIAGLSFPFSMSKQLERGRTQITWRHGQACIDRARGIC